MGSFLKTCWKGFKYFLTTPIFFVVLAFYAVIGFFMFIGIGIKAIYMFFTGRNIFKDFPEDIEAKKTLDSYNTPLKSKESVTPDPITVVEYAPRAEVPPNLSYEQQTHNVLSQLSVPSLDDLDQTVSSSRATPIEQTNITLPYTQNPANPVQNPVKIEQNLYNSSINDDNNGLDQTPIDDMEDINNG